MLHSHSHLPLHLISVFGALLGFFVDPGSAEIEYNTINEDGSFQFRYKDITSYNYLETNFGEKLKETSVEGL